MTDTIERATEGQETADSATGDNGRASRLRLGGYRTGLLLAAFVAVAGGIPLAVALGVLRSPRWYPLLDLAQTELRVRDVASQHPPLVGLAGRINVKVNGVPTQGSHPGPLSFYSLWPFYTLFGATAWALQAAAASLNLIAMAISTWIAHRRGGIRLALGVAAALAVLARAYGAAWLTEAWNPYMPMLWWVVFLLAVWSILCDDLIMLPVAVFAGSFCMQTHIPYAGLVLGMAAFAFAWIVAWFIPRRNESESRWRLFRWGGPSLVLLAATWLPPTYEQFTRPRGNFWMIYENFSDPSEDPAGFRTAVEVWLANLNPLELLDGRGGSSNVAAIASFSVPGLLMLAAWAAAAVYAWRAGHRDQLRLHLVIGVALVLGLISIARILGMVWYYLVLWSLGTTVLMVVATTWTGVTAWRDRLADSERAPARDQLTRWGTVTLAGVLVLAGAGFTYDAAHTDMPAARESRTLSLAAPQAIEALRSGEVVGGGGDGRYLVHWEDSLSIGSQGFGFLLELERQGFDVGVTEPYRTGAVPHRVLTPEQVTAELHYVIGEHAVERWDAEPTAQRIAHVDPRNPGERQQFEQLRDEVVAGLRAAADRQTEPAERDRLRTMADDMASGSANLFVVGANETTPSDLVGKVQKMMDLGLPTAVYVTPPRVG